MTQFVDLETTLSREQERRSAYRGEKARSFATSLEEAAGPSALFLHDRSRGEEGEIPHLAVAPSGIWVIESWQNDGIRVDVSEDQERLIVGGRDKTVLVRGLAGRVEAVRAALSAYDVEVHGFLCFIGATLPRFWFPTISGYGVGDLDLIVSRLRDDGPLNRTTRRGLRAVLSQAFPAA